MFLILSVALLRISWEQETVQAGVYDDAYTFYQTHGSEMSFVPGVKNEGEIYYATKGKKNVSSGIRYTTVGWKVRIFNPAGALVETLYYKLGGSNMTAVDVRTVDGYEYCLYRVTLTNLKSRLSPAGIETLNRPDCNIVFDACISVKKNGTIQGGMTDSGPSWGNVYTTYNGILYAEDWSSATKESLSTYYNKTVDGLFYEVVLSKGAGIRAVSGAGKYCFGTKVTVQAECEEGYHFSNWTGNATVTNPKYSFVLYGNDIHLTANAKENSYRIVFDSAGGQGSIPEQRIAYHGKLQLPHTGILKDGATLSGWTTSSSHAGLAYVAGESVSMQELAKRLGIQKTDGATIVFLASWDEGPHIKTEEIYVSFKDAVQGKITENWLAKKANAYDKEDGEIPYGKNKNTSFFMENYEAADFTELQKEGSVTKTFFAVDSVGNATRKDVLVHIVDTSIYPEEKIFGRVRFISSRYFWDEEGNLISEELGGLEENSIWRWNEDYRGLLEKLFQMKGEN